MFWGLSSSLDLQEEYSKHMPNEENELNILLLGGCDARHILKTISRSHRHKSKQINMFIVENCLELIARQLMLILTALESPQNLGLLEKTRMYLEIYGNTTVRTSTSKYIMYKSNQMIKMITDPEYMVRVAPNINFDGIKYKERDYIEMLLQFWRMSHTNQFDICELWNRRVRSYLGTRYDAKNGVFDWDYNLRLKDAGASTISPHEYKHFRTYGMSFTWIDVESCRPNYTLAAGVLRMGDKFHHRGYVGDIITGPYLAYGLDCEDTEMLRTHNGVHAKRATDISERNVMGMMYEIQMKSEPEVDLFKDMFKKNLGLVSFVQSVVKLSESEDSTRVFSYNSDESTINVDNVRVLFFSPWALDKFPHDVKYKKKFNLIYVSHNLVDRIDQIFIDMLKDDGLLIVESRKFLVDTKKTYIKDFSDKIKRIEEFCRCVNINEFNPIADEFAMLKKKTCE